MHKILEEALHDTTIFNAAKKFSKRGEFLTYGIAGSQKILPIAASYELNPRPMIILTADREKISAWRDDLAELSSAEVVELPELDLIDVNASTIGLELQAKRLEILSRLLRGENLIVLATTAAVVKKDFSRKDFFKSQMQIKLGQRLSLEKFLLKLNDFGYERADEIDSIGKFSVHGGIVDFFPINEPNPCRIEFFGDEVDSMREIDFNTLRSKKKIQSVTILPIKNFSKTSEPVLTCCETVIFDEPARIYEAINNLTAENPELKQKIYILFSSQSKMLGLEKLLAENNLRGVNLQLGTLSDGFTLPNVKLTVLTEKNIFGGQIQRRKKTFEGAGDKIKHFSDIKPGDYVVHVDNGIGKYLGVETLEFDGQRKDFLQIQYGGADKLYIPVEQVQYLQKYVSDDNSAPKLSRLGSGDWIKAKSRAAAAVEDIAEKLLDLYAQREKASGFKFDADDATQREFEEAFPFEETKDQLKAVEDIKRDMQSPRPMDRLICGDVGFGKTEIAIRAAYKAAMNGKQCAVLVPTTVLAQQHYKTFNVFRAIFWLLADRRCHLPFQNS